MDIISSLLNMAAGIGSLIMFILVLIKLFQTEGVLKGILGLICALYTFIWGWIKAKQLALTNYMWIWTACILVSILLGMLTGASAGMQSLLGGK
jgi:hypothetical protein